MVLKPTGQSRPPHGITLAHPFFVLSGIFLQLRKRPVLLTEGVSFMSLNEAMIWMIALHTLALFIPSGVALGISSRNRRKQVNQPRQGLRVGVNSEPYTEQPEKPPLPKAS
jgi:hypothetical protein